MKEKLKKILEKVKAFWGGLSKKLKIIIIAGLSVLLVGAIVLTIVLNVKAKEWTVLFPGMTSQESTEVYKELQEMGVETKINSGGEIEVRKTDWDDLVYRLAEKGYPQSTPSYGIFFDNLSMTMSEFEKKTTLRFALQDRIQTTLKRIDGVKGAIVNINVPESSNYVWKDNKEKATASVLLTLDKPGSFGPERVAAVKNIVAFSAQQVLPEDVSVVDASTGLELSGTSNDSQNLLDDESRINYAQMIKNQYEENAIRILAPIYGPNEITAVAHVVVDYDKVNEEVKELITNEDGEGVKENQHIQYKTEGTVDPGGITGVEDNTDIPNYGNLEDDLNSENTPFYERDTEWAIGYILTQTEKAQGGIVSASIAVVVPTVSGTLTPDEQTMIVNLVKNATNIDEEKITASSRLLVPAVEEDTPIVLRPISDLLKNGAWKYILIGAAILLLLIILLIIILTNRKAKKRIAKAKAENEAALADMQKTMEEDKLRKSIEDAVKERKNASDMTAEDVKEFAKNNPEIAAALIRSLMKDQ